MLNSNGELHRDVFAEVGSVFRYFGESIARNLRNAVPAAIVVLDTKMNAVFRQHIPMPSGNKALRKETTMSLAQVQATVALFVALMISLTGLLTSVAILLPAHAQRAEEALDQSPKRCLLVGLLALLVFAFGIVLLNIPNPLLKLIGFALVTTISGIVTIGGAGMAQLMGTRISEMSGARTTFGALVRGSIAYSVAVFFPYIGWFVLAPLTVVCGLGAGVIAMRSARRPVALAWQPQPAFAGASVLPVNTVMPVTPAPVQEIPASYYPAANTPSAQSQPVQEKRQG